MWDFKSQNSLMCLLVYIGLYVSAHVRVYLAVLLKHSVNRRLIGSELTRKSHQHSVFSEGKISFVFAVTDSDSHMYASIL